MIEDKRLKSPDEQAIQQLGIEHQSWLQHNVTNGLRQALDKLELRLTTFIANESTNKDTPDNIIRLYAAQLKQLTAIKKIIYDTPTFVKSVTQ
jgi:hypothetical protein